MAPCKSIMIQGTSSSCGKSLITTALCRIFAQDGFRVVPFKAQNMSNNSFVTRDGCEMGRAQVVQAYAANVEPDVRMNPVLIKPSSDTGAQVVLIGRPAFVMDARQWHETRSLLRSTIQKCYSSLAADYEMVIIEGAGSPAEINLKKDDVVNMGMAAMADAPVIIVGDIDKGGVFASLVGTMQLLDPEERRRVIGFIINKFRGNYDLLKPGLDELERLTGVPVVGVVPWIGHAIDDEDGVAERLHHHTESNAGIDIVIIRLPHISNFTDFIPLENLPDVQVRWCDRPEQIGSPDLLIIPGTKATVADLRVLKQSGVAQTITEFAHNNGIVLGICGGFQMLGSAIYDPQHTESASAAEPGLDLIAMTTTFQTEKTTRQTRAVIHSNSFRPFSRLGGTKFDCYEIHMGQSGFSPQCRTFTSADGSVSGVADAAGHIAGTYCHGIFDSGEITAGVINALREKRGLAPFKECFVNRHQTLENDILRVADICRKSIDIAKVNALAERFRA